MCKCVYISNLSWLWLVNQGAFLPPIGRRLDTNLSTPVSSQLQSNWRSLRVYSGVWSLKLTESFQQNQNIILQSSCFIVVHCRPITCLFCQQVWDNLPWWGLSNVIVCFTVQCNRIKCSLYQPWSLFGIRDFIFIGQSQQALALILVCIWL